MPEAFIRYFQRPSQISIEAARICCALSSIWIFQFKQLIISGDQVYQSWSINLYQLKGILALVSPLMPSPETIDGWLLLQITSALFLLAGIMSRVSLILNTIAMVWLVSLSESFSIAWSHGYNLSLLAPLAFILAPVGKIGSVDAWIRKKRRNRNLSGSQNGLPVWLLNFAILGIFFNAGFWKLFTTRTTLSLEWAFSENLRNQIIARYPLSGENFPDYLLPILEHAFFFQGIAVLNLFFQLLPMLSLLFVKKPVLRAVLGCSFCIEEIGLSAIMQLHDYHWFIFMPCFIDWDFLLRKKLAIQTNPSGIPTIHFLYAFLFVFTFFFMAFQMPYYLFKKKVNSPEVNTYPFSSYSMYSKLQSKTDKGYSNIIRPAYKVHAIATKERIDSCNQMLRRKNTEAYKYNSKEELTTLLQFYKKHAEEFLHCPVTEIQMERNLYRMPV